MRVQNPDEYAEVLLGVSQPEEKYTAARIRAMYGTSERGITFKHPIPVYITYQTAFADDAGKPQTRADIYGLDRDLLNILHGDRRISDTPIARNYNSSSKPVAVVRRRHDGTRQSIPLCQQPGYTTWGRRLYELELKLEHMDLRVRSASQPADGPESGSSPCPLKHQCNAAASRRRHFFRRTRRVQAPTPDSEVRGIFQLVGTAW